MKSSISLVLIVLCTVVLAAQQSQAKKGCQAYGHVCYGGHGKRSLNSPIEQQAQIQQQQQQELMRPNVMGAAALFPPGMLPNEQLAPVVPEVNYEDYPREFLIKIMKSWFGHPRRPSERFGELDYPISAESYNRENTNAIN